MVIQGSFCMVLGQFLWDFEVPSWFFIVPGQMLWLCYVFKVLSFFFIVLGGLTWFFMSPCLVFMILGGF